MKRNPRLQICKPSTLVSLGIAIAAALVTQPVFGQIPPPGQISITENSSTDLSVTYNRSAVTVLNTSPDHWTLTFATTVHFDGTPTPGWIEPDNSANGNILSFSSNQVFVVSDGLGHPGNFGDGATFLNHGTDSTVPLADGFNITFHDAGDVAAAPDTGSTVGLLALALAALFGASRFRALRFA